MQLEAMAVALFHWAIVLSGYPDPGIQPTLEYQPHEFFVENACLGIDCEVMGWYNDEDVVYLDARMRGLESTYAKSLLVHEFVHFLQDHSGELEPYSCAQQISRERQAYAIQREYMAKVHGRAYFHLMRPAICQDPAKTLPQGPN